MKEASASPRRFTDIQWLRGIAALLVVFEHMKNEMTFRLQGIDPAGSSLAFFPFSAGVDIFFVISGFVIAHSSQGLFGRRRGWSVFLYRRLARIVPLYWLLTLVFIVALFVTQSRLLQGLDAPFVLGSFFFVPVANLDDVPLPILPLGWTLNYEMMFYAIFALALLLPRRAVLPAVAGVLVAIVAAGWLTDPEELPLRFWVDPIILEFLAGIGIHALCARGFGLSNPLRLALALAGFALLFLVGTPAEMMEQRWILWGGPAAMIVLAAASGRGERSGRAARMAEIAGNTSYAVYLFHLLMLLVLSRLFLAAGLTGPMSIYFLYPTLSLIAVAAGSLLLHYGVEAPTLRFLRRRIDRSTVEGPGAVPGP